MNSDNKIIGGMFGLPETVEPKVAIEPHQWKFLDDANLFLANGRSGIMVLMNRLAPTSVWMPSYLCPTMIEAVDKKKKIYDSTKLITIFIFHRLTGSTRFKPAILLC